MSELMTKATSAPPTDNPFAIAPASPPKKKRRSLRLFGSSKRYSSAPPLSTPPPIPHSEHLERQRKITAQAVEKEVAARDAARRARLGHALSMVDARYDAAKSTVTRVIDEQRSGYTLSGRALGLGIVFAVAGPLMSHAHDPSMLENPRVVVDILLTSLPMVFALLGVYFQLDSIRVSAEKVRNSESRAVETDLASLKSTIDEARATLDTESEFHVKASKKKTRHIPRPHLPTSFSKRLNRTGSRKKMTSEDAVDPSDLIGSAAFQKYVAKFLPRERSSELSDVELAFVEELKPTVGEVNWKVDVPDEHKLLIVRGYADKKKRLKESTESVKAISEWYAKYPPTEIISKTVLNATPNSEEMFYTDWWPTRVCAKQDRYGHLVFFDQVKKFNLDALSSLVKSNKLDEMRTQSLEVLQRRKRELSLNLGFRVSKQIYILDLKGISLTRFPLKKFLPVIGAIQKIGGDIYPDTLWSMWIVNTPLGFSGAFKLVSVMVDPESIEKIRVIKSSKLLIKRMQEEGIPLEAIPKELGKPGEEGQPVGESEPLWDMLQRYREEPEVGAAEDEADGEADGEADDSDSDGAEEPEI